MRRPEKTLLVQVHDACFSAMRSISCPGSSHCDSQHFQGLRRAQNKTEPNGAAGDSPRKGDPADNPITRRPGPGRGRPRKHPPPPVKDSPSSPATPRGPRHPTATPGPSVGSSVPSTPSGRAAGISASTPTHPHDLQPGMDGLAIGMPIPVSLPTPTRAPATAGPQEPITLDLTRRGVEDDDDDDLGGQPAKRQKLDMAAPAPTLEAPPQPQPLIDLELKPEIDHGQVEENHNRDTPNEDDAVLALATDGLPDSAETFRGAE